MDPNAEPSVFNYVLSFLLVGIAWGFTTPFIRRAAADFNARQEEQVALSQGGASQSAQPEVDSAEEEQKLLAEDEDEDEQADEDVGDQQQSDNRRDKNKDENVDQEGEEQEEKDTPTPTLAWKGPAASRNSWLRVKITMLFWTIINLLRTPAYTIPLVINLTGSIWFFLLVGKHGTCVFSADLLSFSFLFYSKDMLTQLVLSNCRIISYSSTGQFKRISVYRSWRAIC